MFKTILLFLGSAVGLAITTMATTSRGEVMNNLESWLPGPLNFPTWVDAVVTAVAVMATAIFFGAGVIRLFAPSPLARLLTLRDYGVDLRNERIANSARYADWLQRYDRWRAETKQAATAVSLSLGSRLGKLNEVGAPPRGVVVFSDQHARKITRLSEVLRRVDRYLENRHGL